MTVLSGLPADFPPLPAAVCGPFDAGGGPGMPIGGGHSFSLSAADAAAAWQRLRHFGVKRIPAGPGRVQLRYGGLSCTAEERADGFLVTPTGGGRREAAVQVWTTRLTAADFDALLRGLAAAGWETVFARTGDEITAAELRRGGAPLWCLCRYHRTGETYLIRDGLSCPLDAFSAPAGADGGELRLCQFGLFYDVPVHGRTMNCGMLYLLRLPDGGLVLVDGGEYEQCTAAALAEVWRTMVSLTPPGQRVRVAAWICTHAHNDHTDLFAALLRRYHDRMDVERLVFNFPAPAACAPMPETYLLLERLRQYCPGALYLKPHAGQRFTLAGVDFDVLQTHEDGFGPDGPNPLCGNPNDCSAVLKITFGGTSWLLTGDINTAAETVLLRRYTRAALAAHAVQAAHHLVNCLPGLYREAAPHMALIPSYHYRRLRNPASFAALEAAVPWERMYFAEDGTWQFRPDGQGGLAAVGLWPTAGGPYDGSEV